MSVFDYFDYSLLGKQRVEPYNHWRVPQLNASVEAKFHVTLWPAFEHFPRFAQDPRIQGIRLNSAMMAASEIDGQFMARVKKAKVPLWFDIKGMQLRIREIVCGTDCDHLEFILNRPIHCNTPCPVWFKAGEDCAELIEIRDGKHLIFNGGPRYQVKVGESIHIRNPELKVMGPVFLDYEKEKINKVKKHFDRFYLSYVYEQRHVDEFQELVGTNKEIILKIENIEGMKFVEKCKLWPHDAVHLMAARGDLYMELKRPHEILKACRRIIEKDRGAFVGSRMLLSLVNSDVPSCSDLGDLGHLYEIGFRNFLLCDELCLKEEMLARAVNVFESFRYDYCDQHQAGR